MGGLHPIPRDSIDNDVMAMLDGINKRSKRETFLITSSGPSHPHLMLLEKKRVRRPDNFYNTDKNVRSLSRPLSFCSETDILQEAVDAQNE